MMPHILLLAVILGGAAPAAATSEYILPTLFDVIDVAPNDVLNIREAPSARSAIIGELSPRARGIEVVRMDASGKWARINTEEQSGWVAFRFLAYQVDVWEPGSLPPSLHCYGNEPFWALAARGGTVVFSTPEAPDTALPIKEVLDTGVFRDTRRSVIAGDSGQHITATIVPMACSDGMSDRSYGLDVTVLRVRRGATQMLTGCCSVAPR